LTYEFVSFFRKDEIKHLVTAATRGPNCLKDYVRVIKDYVEVLAKNSLFVK
jgi:hypothetical protein